MDLSGRIANCLILLPSNRSLDRVISKILLRQSRPMVVRTRYHYLLCVGGEDVSINSLRIAVALGHYEKGFFRILEKLVEPGNIVIDVGANEGYVSLYLSTLVGPKGHVFSFEPHPGNVARFKENIRLNQLQNVTVIGKAVSDTISVATLNNDRAWGTILDGIYPSASSIQVETDNLDALYENEPSLAHLHLVKIDVEGLELQVVRGGRNLLLTTRPFVCFEVNLTLLAYATYSVRDLFQFFKDNQYELFIEEDGRLVKYEWLKNRVMNFVAVPAERLDMVAGRGVILA